MTMIDDDVCVKEKREDTRYIQILHRNETHSTGSMGKLNILDLIPNFMPSLGTADLGKSSTTHSHKAILQNSATLNFYKFSHHF